MKRTIFIGDLHGCFDELKLLLKKLSITKDDVIYFVGDYINKGPHSFKVLKFLYKHKEQFFGVLGNQDLNFINALRNGGELNKSQKKLYKKLEEHPEIFTYYKNLPLTIEKDNFLLVHAGVNAQKPLSENTSLELTTIRVLNKKPWYNFYMGEKKIIYGHWATQGVHIGKNVVGLDSGCCYGGFLTAYILETGQLMQQGSLNQYEQIDYTHINPSFF